MVILLSQRPSFPKVKQSLLLHFLLALLQLVRLQLPQRCLQNLKASCLTNFPPLREELKRQNDESINSAVTEICLENSARHSFKSKGNEEQYNHQEKVATHFDSAIDSLHSGKLLEVRNVLGEGKNLVATHMKHIVLGDLHGWDFFTEYKQIPLAEDKSNEKRICKLLKDVESQGQKRKTDKAKQANKFKLDSRRSSPARSYSNEFPVFHSMSGCYRWGKPGPFWRSCYRSRYPPASGSNARYSWQRQLVQLPLQPTIMPRMTLRLENSKLLLTLIYLINAPKTGLQLHQ